MKRFLAPLADTLQCWGCAGDDAVIAGCSVAQQNRAEGTSSEAKHLFLGFEMLLCFLYSGKNFTPNLWDSWSGELRAAGVLSSQNSLSSGI